MVALHNLPTPSSHRSGSEGCVESAGVGEEAPQGHQHHPGAVPGQRQPGHGLGWQGTSHVPARAEGAPKFRVPT